MQDNGNRAKHQAAAVQAALDHQMESAYAELRRLAAHFLAQERPGHTLQPTALVNEAYLRLKEQHSVLWTSRAQFFALAARMMRRILVNHAEARVAEKRGGGAQRVTITNAESVTGGDVVDVIDLNRALEKLADHDGEKVRIVELRFFAGLTNEEAAEVTGRSLATVEREWRVARAWLYRELHG